MNSLPVVKSMAQTHTLKCADVVHLFTAVWVRDAGKMPVTMVASDADLLAAARAEGLAAFDSQDARSNSGVEIRGEVSFLRIARSLNLHGPRDRAVNLKRLV